MNIYVDYDDCLCETGRHFSYLVRDMFGIDVPYEKMKFFNLQKSFDLDDDQYDELLIRGHDPDILLSYEETPGAAQVINGWVKNGHNVSIITGRPFVSYEASRQWLDLHGYKDIRLYCLNKYGDEQSIRGGGYSLELKDYYKMEFDLAIEDSPLAFKFFDHLPDLKVMVYDRPWNKETGFPGDNYFRCFDWESIREKASDLAG